ncbi:MAG: LamG-like jellyroll fold domain-containing protein [Candidatus Poribacteria bacterium]
MRITLLLCVFIIGLMLIGYTDALDMKTAFLIYTFEEGAGETVRDVSGNGNDGIIKGANVKWVKGKNGGGLLLGGTNNSINTTTVNNVGKTYFSECLWANFENLSTEQQFAYISCTGTANARYFYFSSWSSAGAPHDSLHMGTLDKAGNWGRGIATGRLFKTKQWYFIGGVVDTKNGFIRVYVDGAMVQEQKIDTGDTPGTPKEIWIGGTPENYQWINGTIDDVAMFNSALTEQDFNTIMNNGISKGMLVQAQGKLSTTWASIKSK